MAVAVALLILARDPIRKPTPHREELKTLARCPLDNLRNQLPSSRLGQPLLAGQLLSRKQGSNELGCLSGVCLLCRYPPPCAISRRVIGHVIFGTGSLSDAVVHDQTQTVP